MTAMLAPVLERFPVRLEVVTKGKCPRCPNWLLPYSRPHLTLAQAGTGWCAECMIRVRVVNDLLIIEPLLEVL